MVDDRCMSAAEWVRAERHGIADDLLAVGPDAGTLCAGWTARDLAAHVGEQTAWHDPAERFFFRPEYIDQLRALQPGPITQPERYFAVIAKGDELLDWREMTGRYPGAQIRLLEASDHALSDFDQHIDAVLAFLELAR